VAEQDRAGAARLAGRVGRMAPSPTVSLDSRVKELRSQGVDIVNFTAGEPDFPTPEPVKEAARAGLKAELTKYAPVAGTPDLRRAVADKLARENGLSYDPAEIVVSFGGKHSLYNAFMVLCDPGDEVIIPAPYWVSYPEQAKLAGGEPVFVPTDPDRGFHLDLDALARAVTPRTRAIVLNSPSNPTGAVLSRQEIEAVADLARRHDLWVISDEIYEHLVYDGREHVSIAGLEGMKERTILVNGLSKAFAMTGWRVGYAAAPRPVAEAMTAFQGHVTHGLPGFIQAAAVAALQSPPETVQAMVREYDRRRRYVVERLRSMPGVRCAEPEGAFYAFLDISALLGRQAGIETDMDLASHLLEEGRVAVVPGTGFGWPGALRLSYATSMEQLQEGLDRMERVFRALAGA